MARRFLITIAVVAAILVPASGATAVASNVAGCDLDNDGYADLIIGVPHEYVGDVEQAGALHALFGTSGKLSAAGNRLVHQEIAGVQGSAQVKDHFGSAFTCGHFDGDAYEDLAVGIPGERVSGVDNAGWVQVFYGSAGGLSTDKHLVIHRDRPGVAGNATEDADFGSALAAGDFNHDGWDDLAVGVPGATVGPDTGEVHVFYGQPTGLSFDDDERWYVDATGVAGRSSKAFGSALAAGDFDHDGYADLAVGDPMQGANGKAQAGVVTILYGDKGGFGGRSKVFHRGEKGIAGKPRVGAWFGAALAAGDVDGDGGDDLAVGVPEDHVKGKGGAGSVQVLYGGPNGLLKAGDQVWHRASPSVKRAPKIGDRFGFAVVIADFDADGRGDLAVGVPYDDNGNTKDHEDSGSVQVFYGKGSGVDASRDEVWHQGSKGVLGENGLYDGFGSALAAGDYDGNGRTDLAVGIPGDAVRLVQHAGAVSVFYAKSAGISSTGDQLWSQDSPGIGGFAETGDRFGRALG
jgi:FG-GAP repeat